MSSVGRTFKSLYFFPFRPFWSGLRIGHASRVTKGAWAARSPIPSIAVIVFRVASGPYVSAVAVTYVGSDARPLVAAAVLSHIHLVVRTVIARRAVTSVRHYAGTSIQVRCHTHRMLTSVALIRRWTREDVETDVAETDETVEAPFLQTRCHCQPHSVSLACQYFRSIGNFARRTSMHHSILVVVPPVDHDASFLHLRTPARYCYTGRSQETTTKTSSR